jgi:hypothetical protein
VSAPTWTWGKRQLLDTTGKNSVVSCAFHLLSSSPHSSALRGPAHRSVHDQKSVAAPPFPRPGSRTPFPPSLARPSYRRADSLRSLPRAQTLTGGTRLSSHPTRHAPARLELGSVRPSVVPRPVLYLGPHADAQPLSHYKAPPPPPVALPPKP